MLGGLKRSFRAIFNSAGPDYYRAKLARFRSLSHLTIEVHSV
jgi:hypothetical protein